MMPDLLPKKGCGKGRFGNERTPDRAAQFVR